MLCSALYKTQRTRDFLVTALLVY